MPISQRGDARRQGWQGARSQELEIMKGPLNALENVWRDAFEKVVCEAVVCTEKASSNGLIVPARVRHGSREVTFQ